jgi:hypothetical protein
MAATIPAAALVPVAPVFTNTERLALNRIPGWLQRPDPVATFARTSAVRRRRQHRPTTGHPRRQPVRVEQIDALLGSRPNS